VAALEQARQQPGRARAPGDPLTRAALGGHHGAPVGQVQLAHVQTEQLTGAGGGLQRRPLAGEQTARAQGKRGPLGRPGALYEPTFSSGPEPEASQWLLAGGSDCCLQRAPHLTRADRRERQVGSSCREPTRSPKSARWVLGGKDRPKGSRAGAHGIGAA
jgi:hypothetical protein